MLLTMFGHGAATCRLSPASQLTNLSRTFISILAITLSIVGLAVGRRTNTRDVQLCSEVHNRCFGRDGCKFALENYFLNCMDVSDSPTFECTERCKMALTMLMSSGEHDGPNAFRECDCQGEEFCLQQKDRIAVCQEDVQTWLDVINDPQAPIPCYLATLVCSADSECLMAIDYYEDHCKKLQDVTNPRCNSRCNNSLNILYRQNKAQKLQTCYCDGTESYNCTALKHNTQNLCFPPRIRHNKDHTRSHRRRTTPMPHDYEIETNDDTSIGNSIEEDFQPPGSSSRHNSAYTIHSNAGWSCWNYRQSVTLTLTLILVLYTLIR